MDTEADPPGINTSGAGPSTAKPSELRVASSAPVASEIEVAYLHL